MLTSCLSCGTDFLALDDPRRQCSACGGKDLMSKFSPKAVESSKITTALPGNVYEPFQTLEEILKQGPSEAGGSAVEQWLTCPERSRLRAAGVERKAPNRVVVDGIPDTLDAAQFGTLYHAIDAVRWAYGPGDDGARGYLEHLKPQLALEDYDRASNMLRMHEYAYPIAVDLERYEVLANEFEITSPVPRLGGGEPLNRTVRFDRLIRDKKMGELINLELKTSSRRLTGQAMADKYRKQRATGTAIYNANKALVEKYGPLRHTYYQQVTKKETPDADRFGPYSVTRGQIAMSLGYLALPEAIAYPIMPDGNYPKIIHACMGQYRPCEYVGLCWEEAVGDYVWPEDRR